ncbi:phosphoribosyltransferase family protein [Wenjunlia tyrosinilytica]|uniref:Phosphoribosyl transferase n=1 Tax=Wenjunlia tyrosinilytica TaxID=1544741 RepID=A0A918DUD7_9ACTN|nr:phosphoribosyltransferase family protein [Wenjunlia tyrosinilytica]GGO84387.1 hypothetical protein GCM10012280_15750 [Wenjunlia tyrosinilytica]
MIFADRREAGRQLAGRLRHLRDEDVVVVGLPRGGVPVAEQVARALRAPLDVSVVRKLGVPVQPELGMGAVGEDGVRVINDEVVRLAHVSDAELAEVEERERAELDRRAARYRGGRGPTQVRGRTVVVVDDGIATGSTALAACRIARERGAARVVLAVPVAPPRWSARLGPAADELVVLETPADFISVGQFYVDFAQTTDQDVLACLERAAARERGSGRSEPTSRDPGEPHPADAGTEDPTPEDIEVEVPLGTVRLGGRLTVPREARGVVVFAHGSGSSRRSTRNRYVAVKLNRAGLATLLFDLLTEDEARERTNVFDTELLAGRLSAATEWVRGMPECLGLRLGWFGASTGAAAALWAAAEPSAGIVAIVSRGGRPDLAGPRLPEVSTPTLLIVGSQDQVVLDLNREAQARLRCENRLVVVPGASHLFQEPGTLGAVADLARDWFLDHMTSD